MKEEEIRNIDALNKYLKLLEEDARELFDPKAFMQVDCPACNCNNFIFEFEKIGFKYVSCKKCNTLFVNPRPSFESLGKFYSVSKSTSFWVNEFFKPMAEARREKLFKPRAEYLSTILDRKRELTIGDIGAGFGLFLVEMRKLLPGNRYIAIEPSVEMVDICKQSGLEVKGVCVEDLEGAEESFDVLSAFELLEHVHEPGLFLSKINSLLKPGGHLFLTTLNARGFDILLLWKKSKNISPPHHLNFFNPDSIRILLERTGFEVLEISTPGKLDWDIVEKMIKNEGINIGRFWSLVGKEASEGCKEELQNWISKNNLSSHMQILARK